MHVLVVDDNRDILNTTVRLLRHSGFRAWAATSGLIALELAERIQPDHILLDVMMPDMDGWEVLRHLKGNPATAGLPVLFHTDGSEPEDDAAAILLGAIGVIKKGSFDFVDFVARIRMATIT